MAALDEEGLERRPGLRLVLGDDDPLAGGQAVELHDRRVAPADRRQARVDVPTVAQPPVGTPAAAMRSFACAFEPSRRAPSAPGPKTAMPGRRQRVRQPRDQRGLGADDDEVDPLGPGQRDEPVDVGHAHVGAPGVRGDARVARRARARRGPGRAPQRPDDRVLATAPADDEDLHALATT